MDLDELMIRIYCLFDDALAGRRLRQRGPAPTLSDSEVLTMETVGEYLGLDQDTALFAYFRTQWGDWFPGVRRIHRTTFVRQAANLWRVKEGLWQHVVGRTPRLTTLACIDSVPLPACQFARAYRCRRFKGDAAFGKDLLVRQVFYGFRLHVRLGWPGIITRMALAPANVSDRAMVWSVADHTDGDLIGDRNYWSPPLTAELAEHGIRLHAPFFLRRRDPQPHQSRLLSRLRYRIDTVFGQLAERYHIKRLWAKDLWHLGSRLLRKVLSHTVAVFLNALLGRPYLHLAQLCNR